MKNIMKSKTEFLPETMAQKDAEIARLRNELAAKQAEIESLTDRLRTALKMDDITKNQALMTLKHDISWRLRLDYADYIATKEEPYCEGLYGHYRSMLSRIFQVLRIKGITCEG